MFFGILDGKLVVAVEVIGDRFKFGVRINFLIVGERLDELFCVRVRFSFSEVCE